MKNTFVKLRTKAASMKAAVTAMAIAASAGASAQLPTWATGIGSSASDTVTDSAELVGPAIALSILAVIAIKLIKRFSAKI